MADVPDRPYVLLSCGMSIDGYLDSPTLHRLLLSNDALRRSMGREARLAAERFRWSKVAARVEDVYHDLVSQNRGVAVGAHVA